MEIATFIIIILYFLSLDRVRHPDVREDDPQQGREQVRHPLRQGRAGYLLRYDKKLWHAIFLFKESILESELNIIKDGQRPKSVKHFYAIVARSINFADYVL